MKSKKSSLVFLLATVALAGIASWTSLKATSDSSESPTAATERHADFPGNQGSDSENSGVESDALPVSLTDSVQTNPETGAGGEPQIEAFTEPYRDIAVAASEMGTLASVVVHEGDLVHAGDVIAVL